MTENAHRLPWWSWWLSLPLLHVATWLSLSTQFASGAALFYLPFALGIVLLLWWGPRVLPALYLNALLSTPLWGLDWHWAPLYALPETLCVGLVGLAMRGVEYDVRLPNVRSLVRFILFGALLPAALVALCLQSNLVFTGVLPAAQWRQAVLTVWLSDSLALLGVALPLLVGLTLGCGSGVGRCRLR